MYLESGFFIFCVHGAATGIVSPLKSFSLCFLNKALICFMVCCCELLHYPKVNLVMLSLRALFQGLRLETGEQISQRQESFNNSPLAKEKPEVHLFQV